MDTVSKWFIALVTVHALCQLERSAFASVAVETGSRRRPRNLLRQDFQPVDLEFAPRWKFNISTVPKLYMKLQHESVTLKCDARGRPKPAVTWFKDGRQIVIDSHSDNPKYETIGVFGLRVVDLMSAFDRGNYSCVVANRHGSINHTYSVDVVVRFVGPPQLTRGPTNQTAFEGETIQLGCSYYSDMEAFVYWKKQKLLPLPHMEANATNQTRATILQRGDENGSDETEWIIPKAQTIDSGIYSCCATNVYGTSCRQATIRINPGQWKTFKAEVSDTGSPLMMTVFPVAVGIFFLVLSGSIILICFLRRRTYRRKIMFKNPDVVNPIYLNLPPTSTHLIKSLQIPIDEKWMISSEDLRVDALIGLGAFGMVYVGHWSQGTKAKPESTQSQPAKQSTLVAVKMLKDGSTEEDLRCFLKEIEVMKNIFACHINVIGFIGCCTQNGQLQMVVEFARYGNLRDFLKDRRNLPPVSPPGFEPTTLRPGVGSSSAADDVISRRCQPPHEMLVSFAFQAARGLEYLASKNVIHRDVACRNVLLADDLVVKIADFGLTRILDPDLAYYRRHTADLLPIRWMSPESLADNKYSMKSDVWSFGVLLWEIFSLADVPYESVPVENLLSILKNGSRLQKPNLATTDVYRTMVDCWQHLPQDRPTFTELVARLEASLSRVAAADYLLLDDKAQSEETSIASDEEVFHQTSESKSGQPERILSASRSADSQYSSWSSDHTNSDASRVHLLPHRTGNNQSIR